VLEQRITADTVEGALERSVVPRQSSPRSTGGSDGLLGCLRHYSVIEH
jgi:hypothetical protein